MAIIFRKSPPVGLDSPAGAVPDAQGGVVGDAPALRKTTGIGAAARTGRAVIAGVVPDLVDSVLASVAAFTPLEFERGTITENVPYARDNFGAVEAASGVAGLVGANFLGPEVAALKALDGANKVSRPLRAVFASNRQVQDSLKLLKAADVRLAKGGFSGREALTAPIRGFGKTSITRDKIARAARITAAKRALGQGVATEAIIAATLNENDFIIPDDASATSIAAMAFVGLGVGQLFEQIAIGAAFRKGLQTPEVLSSRVSALDAGVGIAEIKANAFQRGVAARGATTTTTRNADVLGALDISKARARIDEVVIESVQLNARRLADSGISGDLARNRQTISQANLEQSINSLNVVTQRGIFGNKDSGFSMLAKETPQAQTLQDLQRKDPLALLGVSHLGRFSDDAVDNFNSALGRERTDALTQLLDPKADLGKRSAASQKLKAVNDLEGQIPVVLVDGEIVPFSLFRAQGKRFNDSAVTRTSERVEVRGPKGKMVKEDSITLEHTPTGVKFNTRLGKLGGKGRGDVTKLDADSARAAYGLGDLFIQKLPDGAVHTVPDRFTFFDLDLAEEALRQRGSSINVVFPKGLTREGAQIESLALKVDALRSGRPIPAGRVALNLPGTTELQRLGESTTIEDAIAQGLTGKAVRETPLRDLQRSFAEMRRESGTLAETGPEFEDLMGRAFVRASGKSPFSGAKALPTEPVLAFRAPLQRGFFTREALEARRADDLASTFATLTKEETSSPTIKFVTDELLRDADFLQAADLSRLDLSTLQTSLRSTDVRQGIFSLQDFAAAGNQTLLAGQRLFRKVSAVFERDFDKFLDSPVGPAGIGSNIRQAIGEISKKSNLASRLSAEQFFEARKGFQLSGKVVQGTDGKFEFVLRNTEANRRQFEVVTGNPRMPEDATLPLINGKPLGVDQLALDSLNALDAIAGKIWKDKNALNRANGLTTFGREPFYIPPQEGEFRALILDGSGKTIRTITAESDAALDRKILAQERDKSSILNRNQGAQVKKESQLRASADILGRAEVEFLDPSHPFVQSVKGANVTGAGASPFSIGRSFEDIVRQFKKQSQDTTGQLMETLFRPQLNEARARSAIAASRASKQGERKIGGQSIEDLYISTLTGRLTSTSATSATGHFFRTIDNALQLGLDGAHSSFVSLGGRKVFDGFIKKNYDEAVKKLGERTPFENVGQILAERGLFQTPPAVSKFAQSFNSLATNLLLRYDVGHAVTTLAGIATTFPAVAASLRPKAGQTFADIARQMGVQADVFLDPASREVFPMFSVEKEAANAIRDMFSAEGRALMDEATKLGHLDAAISEMHRDFGRVKDASTFGKLMDKANFYAGFLSDNAEQFAVTWSFMTAQRLLKRMGVVDDVTRMTMARKMVDESIANFSPLNRPQVYQSGGLGTSLGLFQTFMFNYTGRMFRYIENRQTRTLAIQAAMQAQVFGLNSVPGMTQYNDFIFNVTRGHDDPQAEIYNRVDTRIADAIFYGTPATVGLLFGLDRNSIPDLTGRGNVDPRVPSFPGISGVSTILNGINSGIALFRRDNPAMSTQQVGEVLQRHVVNRPLSAMISLFWTKALVDPQGNLIAEETNTALGIVSRAMGLRTIGQTARIKANARFRQGEAMRLERRATLNAGVNAAFRGGSFDDKKLVGVFKKFIETGGSSDEFGGFLQQRATSATQDEATRALISQIKGADAENVSSRMDNILKLFFATREGGNEVE